MRITYTAQEMYEHIRSYDIIEFWGSRNEENVCMIKAKSSCVALRKGKRYSYISIECQFDPRSDIICCCCNITGNVFSCEVERGKVGAPYYFIRLCRGANHTFLKIFELVL